jgi:TctA family transporter
MELIGNLAHGFGVALTLNNLLFCLIGCIIGTAIGVLPGIGPVATISLLLPITFGQPATTAIIMSQTVIVRRQSLTLQIHQWMAR